MSFVKGSGFNFYQYQYAIQKEMEKGLEGKLANKTISVVKGSFSEKIKLLEAFDKMVNEYQHFSPEEKIANYSMLKSRVEFLYKHFESQDTQAKHLTKKYGNLLDTIQLQYMGAVSHQKKFAEAKAFSPAMVDFHNAAILLNLNSKGSPHFALSPLPNGDVQLSIDGTDKVPSRFFNLHLDEKTKMIHMTEPGSPTPGILFSSEEKLADVIMPFREKIGNEIKSAQKEIMKKTAAKLKQMHPSTSRETITETSRQDLRDRALREKKVTFFGAIGNFFAGIGSFFANIIRKIASFVTGIFTGKQKEAPVRPIQDREISPLSPLLAGNGEKPAKVQKPSKTDQKTDANQGKEGFEKFNLALVKEMGAVGTAGKGYAYVMDGTKPNTIELHIVGNISDPSANQRTWLLVLDPQNHTLAIRDHLDASLISTMSYEEGKVPDALKQLLTETADNLYGKVGPTDNVKQQQALSEKSKQFEKVVRDLAEEILPSDDWEVEVVNMGYNELDINYISNVGQSPQILKSYTLKFDPSSGKIKSKDSHGLTLQEMKFEGTLPQELKQLHKEGMDSLETDKTKKQTEDFKKSFLALNLVNPLIQVKETGSNTINIKFLASPDPDALHREYHVTLDNLGSKPIVIVDTKDPFHPVLTLEGFKGKLPVEFDQFSKNVLAQLKAETQKAAEEKALAKAAEEAKASALANANLVNAFNLPKASDLANATPVSKAKILNPDHPIPVPTIPDPVAIFPNMLSDVQIVDPHIGGSTGAKKVEAGGLHYVMKEGANAGHIAAEYHANKAYQALGVKVPDVLLYNKTTSQKVKTGEGDPPKPVMLAGFVPKAVSLASYLQTASIDAKEEVLSKIRANFVADALLANWDVVGMGKDNILVMEDGTPVRIDNGSAFEYRAQGGLKSMGFANEVTELDTMRKSSVNQQAAEIFGGITDKEIIWQIDDIALKMPALLLATPAKYHETLKKRMESLQKYKGELIKKQQTEQATLALALVNPNAAVTFNKNHSADGLEVNGVPFKPTTKIPNFASIQDKDVGEPPFVPQPGYHTSAGVIIMEPDGRVWIYEPKNHFGGYNHTYPKGRIEKGLSMQQTAIKEALEESGLQVEIEGFLMDQVKSTTKTRYYIARRVGGDPSQAHWEADNVKLVPAKDLKTYVNVGYDQTIADKIVAYQSTNPMPVKKAVAGVKVPFEKIEGAKVGDDFWQLKQATTKPEYLSNSLYTIRWGDILCPKETAVTVEIDGKTKHLHANNVSMEDGAKYIAIQAPGTLEHDAFVKLVNETPSLIVDLTNPNDKAKDKSSGFIEKRYFPKQVGKVRHFKDFNVTCTEAKDIDKISVYTYIIKDKATGKEKTIQRVHYKEWPDHGAVNPTEMAKLIAVVDNLSDKSPGPVMVHCRAGVGRTGTFITARTAAHLKEQGSLSPEGYQAKVHEIILHGRKQRGPSFVQTAEQLKSLYEFGNSIYGGDILKTAAEEAVNSLGVAKEPFDIRKIPQFVADLDDSMAAEAHLSHPKYNVGDWIVRYSTAKNEYVLCLKTPKGNPVRQLRLPGVITQEILETTVQSISKDAHIIAKTNEQIIKSADHGKISREEALARLTGQAQGTYLLRDSISSPGKKLISFYNSMGDFVELSVTTGIGGKLNAENASAFQNAVTFAKGTYDNYQAILNDAYLKAQLKDPLPPPGSSLATPPKPINTGKTKDEEILEKCYLKGVDKPAAMNKLQPMPTGTYLIRDSKSQMGALVISFYNSSSAYNEILLSPKMGGGWAATQASPYPLFGVKNVPDQDFPNLEAVFNQPYLKQELKRALGKSDQEILNEAYWGSIDFTEIEKKLKAAPIGSYIVRESSQPGKYTFFYSTADGSISIITVGPSPHAPGKWITSGSIPGKQFDKLHEMMNDPEFQGLLKKPLLHPGAVSAGAGIFASPFKKSGGSLMPVTASNKFDFNHPWGIVPNNPGPLPKSPKLTPSEILSLAAQGRAVKGDEFYEAAEEMRTGVLSAKELTTLHTLYDKAAEQYSKEGNIERAFKARSQAAEYAGPNPGSPLHDLDAAIQAGSTSQLNPALGAHFSSLDTGILKGGHLRAFNRNIDGKPMTEMQFKVSKPARRALQQNLLAIQTNLADFQNALPSELKGKVRISEVDDCFLGKDGTGKFNAANGYTPNGAKALQIEFEGVGAVVIGNSPSYSCLFNSIKVLVNSGQKEGVAAQQMHQMLTMLGIGPILNEQRQEDDRRLLAAQIFRTYYPSQAVKMERTKEFYELPVDALIQKIEAEVPEMVNIFKKYRDNPGLAVKTEIYKGRTTWALTDISTQMRAKNAYGLMAGVGYSTSKEDAAKTCAIMLKGGGLSSEERFHSGLFAKGASSETDLATGGGDQVFTRLINQKTIGTNVDSFSLASSYKFMILYDLDAVNGGAYGFNSDYYGSTSDYYGCKNPDDHRYNNYLNRESLIDFAGSAGNTSNEVMVKNSVSPDHIRGFVCRSQSDKDALVAELTTQGLIVGGMIKGKPVDEFIHVATKFKATMWNK
ncbi:protein-tyrosine phosphatase family protein [Estrella lausannensis]|uniref:protein-tyrosine-phosphatase n=1 Tax=Estrella lausannensis TaxID=483423 RepID=A0A0H5DPW3_9BACT|nr:protein-tyrosine phosphatase family protein [Estrella lausannensis]CRX37549.1 hypothetical protein ELAC_0188 [Estrella lausannensis]